jgi:hypothetical protein
MAYFAEDALFYDPHYPTRPCRAKPRSARA